MSHIILAAELKILNETLESETKEIKKALALKHKLKVSVFTHFQEIEKC